MADAASATSSAFRQLAATLGDLAPDDPRLVEISQASHAKQIGRFIPGDPVARELIAAARAFGGSPGAAVRLLEVLVTGARNGTLGPRTGPCAFCPGLEACLG